MVPKFGDWVQVKPDVSDPDFPNLKMGGWVGRIIEVDDDQIPNLYCIKWSVKTQKGFSKKLIRFAEEQGICLTKMYLPGSDFEIIPKPEDEPEIGNVEWDYGISAEQNARISEIINGIDSEDVEQILASWEKHLRSKVSFPFEAIVTPDYEGDDASPGDVVKVLGIEMIDDLYGIIVVVSMGKIKSEMPLCDLEVKDRKSLNYEPVKDYVVWFANK